MADTEIIKYISTKTGLGLKYISKDEKISIDQIYNLSADDIEIKINETYDDVINQTRVKKQLQYYEYHEI
jgi:hypothetical protein